MSDEAATSGPGPDMQQLARAGLAGKAISAAVLAATDQAREQLLAQMLATGAERIRVSAEDAPASLGTVSYTPGRIIADVVDEAAFTAWVAKQYPSEITPAVRPAFRDKLLREATAAGLPVDTATGAEIPGVRVAQGDPFLTTRPNAEARRRALELVQGGGLQAITTRPKE